MQITSIEVIRHNPGVAVGVVVGERVELTYGDTLKVDVSFDYRGLKSSVTNPVTLYGSIGVRYPATIAAPSWFDEKVVGEKEIDLPDSFEFTPQTASVNIPITSDIGPGTDYDLYVKIKEYPKAGYPEIDDVIDIIGLPPVYELIQHTIHPAAYVYEDEAEVCTIEFPLWPEQLPFAQWGGLKLAEAFANAIEREGNSILELKVYEDTTPVFWTNYRVEIKAAVASEEEGVAWGWLVAIGGVLATLPWKAIIIGALSVIGIWVVGWVIEKLIKAVDRVIHKPPALTDEIIDSLGREDLIPMILYKAPRVEYEVSPETLEGMSDDGLRALLKELRDRQVEAEWWPLVIVGGLAVLGVGAALALAAPRRSEGHNPGIVSIVAAQEIFRREEERKRREKEKPKGLRW